MRLMTHVRPFGLVFLGGKMFPASNSGLFPSGEDLLIVSLFTTSLCVLDFSIFALETTGLTLRGHGLFNKCFGSIFLVDSRAVELCRPFNHCSYLRKCGYFALSVVLLIMPVRIEDGSHLDELEVALELGSYVGFRKAKPIRTGGHLIILAFSQQGSSTKVKKAKK